jgi:S-adenosylmethionine:tRNA ribosyltransferase-isomerase
LLGLFLRKILMMVEADEKAELALEDFSYDLPEHLIAQQPLNVRHESRLLYLNRATKTISHQVFRNLPTLLKPSDLIVVNDTRVIPARLVAQRASGGIIKLLLIKSDPRKASLWQAFGSPLKRLRPGEMLTLIGTGNHKRQVKVTDIFIDEDGQKRLLLDLGSSGLVFEILKEVGYAPLPPYILRKEYSRTEMHKTLAEDEADESNLDIEDEEIREGDLGRYQTVYANEPGAVAAPTAGLHFSNDLLKELESRGNEVVRITLHVGPGTFKPITGSVTEHTVESERYTISEVAAQAINNAKQEGRRVVAVGTTSCRALESSGSGNQIIATENGTTSLYIRPGYQFRIVDGLITNFHLSKSSLLVLVSAFVGREAVLSAYREAVSKEYRFYSYGDAMLII